MQSDIVNKKKHLSKVKDCRAHSHNVHGHPGGPCGVQAAGAEHPDPLLQEGHLQLSRAPRHDGPRQARRRQVRQGVIIWIKSFKFW